MVFSVSVLLLAGCSLRLCLRFSSSPADSFWIFVATVMMQLGAIAGLTSSFHQLHPAGWIVAQLAICALVLPFGGSSGALTRARLRSWWLRLAAVPGRLMTLSTWAAAALVLIVAMVVLSAITQAATPIHTGDEKMYHASRVIYWIQNRSVFPFITHNDRQNIIPFGSELFFLWPVLLTKSETAGRIVFWLAYPCAAIGQYLLLRAMKLSAGTALVGVLILITTPLVAASAIGLKPEVWSIVGLLGTSYWLVSIRTDAQGLVRKCFWLGAFTMLSMNVRPFALLMLPAVVLVPLLARSAVARIFRFRAVAAGLACGCLSSGLIIPIAFNLVRDGHPLGPAGARRVVMADISPRQLYTHAVRFGFVLLELPDLAIPIEARERVDRFAGRIASAVGANRVLPLEAAGRWPGLFSHSLPEQATGFSLWGLLWIPTLALAVLLLVRNVVATWPDVELTAISVQTLTAVPVLLAILAGARWMADSQVPMRYLIGPYALTVPIGLAVAAALVRGRALAEAAVLLAIAISVYQPIRLQARDAVQAIASPLTERDVNQGFEEALDLVPARSRILFVGNADAPDYPLFAPARHYANTVVPWGKAPFDPARMRGVIDAQHVTHVLIQHDDAVLLHWDPDLRTREMAAWLGREAGINEITLGTAHMRLFETSHATERYERPYETTVAPASAPLIRIGSSLRQQVGIDPLFLRTPWAVEGESSGGHLWMGQGRDEGIALGLWSREARTVDVQFAVAAGPSLTAPDRTVMLLVNGAQAGDRRFQGTAEIVFRVALHPGRNLLEFFALDAPNVRQQPNGDPRRLIVLLREVRAESEPARPARAATDGSRDGSVSLATLARRAADVVVTRQQIPGYWLTAYTSSTSFGRPQFEMNTYLTSVMIDVLQPTAAVTGIADSLERARRHLSDQIEAAGLVRYHGRPDARTIGALGCAITPDADDTALVWRLAPIPRPELLPAALATLAHYRTDDGLYRTWLSPVAQYQCLDPGRDPDPADATIQMHILMLLAKADPPAAGALCTALRRAIDEDRVWVYYSQAPLVPVLRQADMQQSGCALPLPPSRTRAASPEQDAWVEAARIVQGFPGTNAALPDSAAVIGLLQRLAADDFAFIRQHPPLMYHNDLTATVPRYYWSEEFGYALWLRLYTESERRGLLPAGAGKDGGSELK